MLGNIYTKNLNTWLSINILSVLHMHCFVKEILMVGLNKKLKNYRTLQHNADIS